MTANAAPNLFQRIGFWQRVERKPDEWSGQETVKSLFMLGPLLLLIGVAVMTSNWPSSESYSIAGEVYSSDTGSGFGAFIGAVLAVIGQTMLFIAIIACGVRIGTRPDVPTLSELRRRATAAK